MVIPLPGLSRLYAGLYFFTLENCLTYIEAHHKPAIYLQFTSFFYVGCMERCEISIKNEIKQSVNIK